MNKGKVPPLVSLCLSVLLHLLVLFRIYVGTVPERTLEGDGKVALVKAVIMSPAASAQAVSGPPTAEMTDAPADATFEEAQLKLQRTEVSLPPAVPEQKTAAAETISTVPEVAMADAPPVAETAGSSPPTDVSTEGTETPAADGKPGDGAPITHVPVEPEAGAAKTGTAAAEPEKSAAGDGQTAPKDQPRGEEVAKEVAEPPLVPQDLPDTARFIPIYRVDKKPQLVRKAVLSYPAKARELNIQGTVILEVNIDEQGKVGDIRIVKGAGFGLDEEAVRWMRASSFSPAYVQDKPVAVRMNFPVTFTLNK